jgi:hypothetical protein
MDYPDAHLEASHYSHAVAGPAAHRKCPPKRSLDGAPSRADRHPLGWATPPKYGGMGHPQNPRPSIAWTGRPQL